LKQRAFLLIICLTFLFLGGGVKAQGFFKVIGGIPHLPAVDVASVKTPQPGMLVYSTQDRQPMIYSGSAWETLCSNNINATTVKDYLEVKSGIPYLSALSAAPSAKAEPGAIYLSKTDFGIRISDGISWQSVAQLFNGTFTQNSGFSTNSGLKVSKFPVLSLNPNVLGIDAGAIYLNAISKTLRYYNGTTWTDISCLPVITTMPVTAITNVAAFSGVNILNNGGSSIILQGICWSKERNPDTALKTKTANLVFGKDIGLFPGVISGLAANTLYHVRAYAVNNAGLVYGDEVIFTSAPAEKATIATIEISNFLSTSANSGGIISNDGGAPITARGITWSSLGDPAAEATAIKTLDGSGVGNFPSQVINLLRNTIYYVRAYAINIAGIAYGNLLTFTTPDATAPILSSPNIKITDITDVSAISEVNIISNGGELVTERGVSWSTDRINIVYGPSTVVNPTDIGIFSSNLSHLLPGTTYYVRGYAKNAIGTTFSSESSFITTSLPTLTTIKPLNYDLNSHVNGWLADYNGTLAQSGGEITSAGVSPIIKRGLVWSTLQGPTTALLTKTEQASTGRGTGIFYNYLTSLVPGTTYYVRAYAVNSMGTAYGEEYSFTTPQLPELTTLSASGITNIAMSSGGHISGDGRIPVIRRGICWGLTPTLSVEGNHTDDGVGSGEFVSILSNLMGGTRYYMRAYAINNVGIAYGDVQTFETNPAKVAEVITSDMNASAGTTATAGGTITANGGAEVVSRGVIWSLVADFVPDINTGNTTTEVGGNGTFSSTVTNLLPNRTYYLKAYAVNSAGVSYGNTVSFKTYSLPTLTTSQITAITNIDAAGGGNVLSDGGSAVTKSGIVWSTLANPTVALPTRTEGNSGMGNFINNLTGLRGNTTYYVRAYAINGAGIAYGNEVTFTTAPPTRPVLITASPVEITGFTARSGGILTNDGGGALSAVGLVWSKSAAFLPDTVLNNKTIQQSAGSFSSMITGLQPGTVYYVRAYAENAAGRSYGNEVAFKTASFATITTVTPFTITNTSAISGGSISNNGGSFVQSNGICWSTVTNPTIEDQYVIIGSGTGDFNASLVNLMGATTYYVRAFARNSAGVAYGNLEVFTTSKPLPPTVTTAGVTAILGATAMSGGNITNNGGGVLNTRGVLWSTDPDFNPDTVSTQKTAETGYNVGAFVSMLTKLTLNKTYYVRAYAVNNAGTGYGAVVSFTTPAIPVPPTDPPVTPLPMLPVVSTNLPMDITKSTAIVGGTASGEGSSAVSYRGIVWSTVDNFIPDLSMLNKMSLGSGSGSFEGNMNELIPDTKYYIRAYAGNAAGTVYGQQLSFTTKSPALPVVTTLPASSITGNSANTGGDIKDDGGVNATTRGMVWSTVRGFDPATAIQRTIQTGTGKGVFSANITGLGQATIYYIRAYATNSAGTGYGEEQSFTTLSLPVLTTNSPLAITNTSAIAGGTISNDGGLVVTARGVVWSTVENFEPVQSGVNRISMGSGSGSFSGSIKDLVPDTKYYLRAYAETAAGLVYGQQLSLTTYSPTLPVLTTLSASSVTGSTASTGGEIKDDGGVNAGTRGMVWSMQKGFDPTTALLKSVQTGTGKGIFVAVIAGLNQNTTYYMRAYATNRVGTGYGDELSFTTQDLPVLRTTAISANTGSTAVSGGTISYDGGGIIKQGICWSLSPNPTTDLSTVTIDGGSGTFTSMLKDLKPHTVYYVRAYAVNAIGTGYGNEIMFASSAVLASLTTTNPVVISDIAVSSGGTISSDGGAMVTARGIVWSTKIDFKPDTVVNNKTTDGQNIGTFMSELSGMIKSMSYYIRAYAQNSIGTAYGNQFMISIFPASPRVNTAAISEVTVLGAKGGGEVVSDGGAVITRRGICWSTERNPTIALATKTINTEPGEGTFTGGMTGLLPNTVYYVRAYAENAIGVGYGLEESFITPTVPTLSATTIVTNIRATTASSGGEITDDGRSPILSRGLVWSIYSSPILGEASFTADHVTQGLGIFTADLSLMKPNTTYYVRAYATNSAGTTYGSERIFKTNAVQLPALTTTSVLAVDAYSATADAEISDDGGMPVTSRGLVWSTTSLPTIELSAKVINSAAGTGVFTNVFTGLIPGTTYYVRSFATNSLGTGYGNELVLTAPLVVPQLSAVRLSNLTKNSTDVAADLVFNGGTEITDAGFIWSKEDTISQANIGRISTVLTGNTFNGTLVNLLPDTKYYVWAYAVNAAGTGYSLKSTAFTSYDLARLTTTKPSAVMQKTATSGGTITSSGGVPILARGVCWGLGKDPVIESSAFTTDGTATGSFTSSITGMETGTRYYVRAYATNSQGTAYGNLDSLYTVDVPTVVTMAASTVSNTFAISGGKITKNYGLPILSKGVIWDKKKDPAVALATKTNDGADTTSFTSTLSPLSKLSTYYFRAYATNVMGTGYGQLDSLVTKGEVPEISRVAISEMTATTAKGTAAITNNGGGIITEQGFIWNTTGIPTLETGTVIANVDGTVSFSNWLTGLDANAVYYIRAYARNSVGLAYSQTTTSFRVCPTDFTVIHKAGLGGAAVDKTVTYSSVTTTGPEAAKCWLTKNLGAERQPTGVSDASEAAAGWYWQFNKIQGYKYEGNTRTPNTVWNAAINENSDWLPENDPCAKILGGGWRIPTSGEWAAVGLASQNWTSPATPYSSPLKLHSAGYLSYINGVLESRSTVGDYWTSTQASATTGNYLYIQGSIRNDQKSYALSLRCLRDNIVETVPSVSNVDLPAANMTATSALGLATVSIDGGTPVTARGLVWNTTGTPTLADNVINAGTGTGDFSGVVAGLNENDTYYVRAFATNAAGTSYSPAATSFKICLPFTVRHKGGSNGAAVDKTVTYTPVNSSLTGSAKCWITQNLGADHEATAVNDATEASAGWYWQFNTLQGYKLDGATRTPNTTWTAVTASDNNWTLVNDPCARLLGGGWRIPTSTEWIAAATTGNWVSQANGFASVLKLHGAGYSTGATAIDRGTATYFWSATQGNSSTAYFYYNVGIPRADAKSYAFSLRCLRDAVVKTAPLLSEVSVPAADMTATTAKGSAAVTMDGGSAVTARGLVWNTTGTPTLADNVINAGTGTGDFTATISGITEGVTYYVSAFATNGTGTSYSLVKSFKICLPVTVIHKAGVNGSAVDKTVTYKTINTDFTGTDKCWITQNLGADREASALNDATEASSGWYWQFNKLQGIKSEGGTMTPGTAWVSSISENTDWLPANDPCARLLGWGWRIPTSTEFAAVAKAPQNWTGMAMAFESPLKFHYGGYLLYTNGVLTGRGSANDYWTSNQSGVTTGTYINDVKDLWTVNSKTYGFTIRCLKDIIAKAAPVVSNAVLPSSAMTANSATGSAEVIADGGATVTGRGLVWNTGGNPTLSDNVIAAGAGSGSFTAVISGLTKNTVYYVRAYATNENGTGYSPVVTKVMICLPVTVVHQAGVNGSAVSKTITYNTVNTGFSGTEKCWITQNLGADVPAASAVDATDAAAGWYWQFNNLQGYKNDGTTRTPNTTWISAITDNSNWVLENDPCARLLGWGWRIPTSTEWTAVPGTPQNWTVIDNGYASVLKMHSAGYLNYTNGVLTRRGIENDYWSTTQTSATTGSFITGGAVMTSTNKAYALNLRCIKDEDTKAVPSLSKVNLPAGDMTASSAKGIATVTLDGGSAITARGLVWNTTGTPTLSDHVISGGVGIGEFNATISGLTEGTAYYVRAYATNATGTAYSALDNRFMVCAPVTVVHEAGVNGSAVSKTITYNTVNTTYSGADKCWIIQNLGADNTAVSATDASETAAGWYWQFNKLQGFKNDGTTRTPNTAWVAAISDNTDWLAENDPCARLLGWGWRMPTAAEWTKTYQAPQNWTGIDNGFTSPLKFHSAGYLNYADGVLTRRGVENDYWSSTQASATTGAFITAGSQLTNTNKAYALTMRCLKDNLAKATPGINTVTLPATGMTTTSITGSTNVYADGGSAVTARGLVWNTTGNPTLSDNFVAAGTGTGSFNAVISGLTTGQSYFVRAYATNATGTGYSVSDSKFQICEPVTVVHKAGVNGSAVDKTVTYKTVNSNVSGENKCWITKNLGADQEAATVNDGSEAAAGWYWQFNNLQGYKNEGTTLTPNTAWTTSISGNTDWLAANDPCMMLLGWGWRIPTSTEYITATKAPQNWTSAAMAYASPLKLHNGGYLHYTNGSLVARGTASNYWTSTQSGATTGIYISNANEIWTTNPKSYGFNVRCLKDPGTERAPVLSNVDMPLIDRTATGSAKVIYDGGSPVTARGIVWNTTGMPTLSDNIVAGGAGTEGSFSATISGITDGTVYYVRAYATNKSGTSYSPVVTPVAQCATPFVVTHKAGTGGAAVDKTVTYQTVRTNMSGAYQCWIAKNLGADVQATTVNDASEAAAGWYWQFNRLQGYKNNGTKVTPTTAWVTSIDESSNWTLANDPCAQLLGSGWRIPTATEWTKTFTAPKLWSDMASAYGVIKLHHAGYLHFSNGSLQLRGTENDYWSSTQSAATTGTYIYNANQMISQNTKAYAFTVRCLRNDIVRTVASVSTVSIALQDNVATATASVIKDGDAPVTARGLVWNTTGNPTIADHVISGGTGVGSFSGTINGVNTGVVYYVRAFATNELGTAYSPSVAPVAECATPFTLNHKAGVSGAAVDKTVVYKTTRIKKGEVNQCWIAQNLGADAQASAVNDATEAAAGWYWQFNKVQGYKHDGTARTPNTVWTSSISEDSNWLPENDPCAQLLGGAWRIPTATEWVSSYTAPASWSDMTTAYASIKMHHAGYLNAGDGSLQTRGTDNDYWSSTQSGTTTGTYIYWANQMISRNTKAYAFTLRCLRVDVVRTVPVLSNADFPLTGMSGNTANGTASVTKDGGAAVTARGMVWNTTGQPTIADQVVSGGSGLGTFTGSVTGIADGSTYFVRAFATNEIGTSYSAIQTRVGLCNPFTITHKAGVDGAAVDKTVTYKVVNSSVTGANKCWITQNLGALNEAATLNDATEAASGWYWQFNRLQGYKHDGTARTPNAAWITSISETSDWLPENDPCSRLLGWGWRVPTSTEWNKAIAAPQNWTGIPTAYQSPLKLHYAGYLNNADGVLAARGTDSDIWSGTSGDLTAGFYMYNAYTLLNRANTKTYGLSIRCLRD